MVKSVVKTFCWCFFEKGNTRKSQCLQGRFLNDCKAFRGFAFRAERVFARGASPPPACSQTSRTINCATPRWFNCMIKSTDLRKNRQSIWVDWWFIIRSHWRPIYYIKNILNCQYKREKLFILFIFNQKMNNKRNGGIHASVPNRFLSQCQRMDADFAPTSYKSTAPDQW